jgi:thioredoxin
MATIELTKDNLEETINNNDIVIIDFWAPWCGPCKMFGPIFEETSEKNSDMVFAKVNTEEHQELAGMFQIRSIPTLMVFREKVIIYSEAGALQGPQLEQLLEQVKALDMEKVHKEIAEQQQQQQG